MVNYVIYVVEILPTCRDLEILYGDVCLSLWHVYFGDVCYISAAIFEKFLYACFLGLLET